MLRGEFIRADGLVIPNNITTYGVRTLFHAALRDVGYALHLGLANCNPDPDLQLEALNEPTIGVNGYARIPIVRTDDWPVWALFNGEQYIETSQFVFAAVGGAFDKPISRMVITNHLNSIVGEEVFALSGALPAELTIDEATPVESRTFKYRIYGR